MARMRFEEGRLRKIREDERKAEAAMKFRE
jgi:hypothetical protein